MDSKRILIVARTFYPANSPRSFRATELANEFARQGHDVTILIPKDKVMHPKLEKEFGYTIKDLGKPSMKEIQISGGTFFKRIKRIFRRILLLLFEYPDIEYMFKTRKALLKEDNYDLLISIAVPHVIHWGVALARNKNHRIAKVWVADCGDPYMGCKTDSLRKIEYFKFIEKYWGRMCDFISVPHRDMINDFYFEFMSKIIVIPQGFKFLKLQKIDVNNSVPTFAFAGVLSEKYRNPRMFLEYLLTLKFDFKFIVYSKFEMLNEYVIKLNNKLEIRELIPRDQLMTELMKMDFLVNIENKSIITNNSNYSAPSKLIDYTIANRPILSLNMEKFEPQKVDEFLMKDYSNRLVVDNVERFRIENVTLEFLDLINR